MGKTIKFHQSTEPVQTVLCGIALKKNSPYISDVNRVIDQARSMGIPMHEEEKYLPLFLRRGAQKSVERNIKDEKGRLIPLNLTHLAVGFLLWVFGIACSLLRFSYERNQV